MDGNIEVSADRKRAAADRDSDAVSAAADRDDERDRRPRVTARFPPEEFERIRHIKRERGLSWRAVILAGVAQVQTLPTVENQLPDPPRSPVADGWEDEDGWEDAEEDA